MVFGPPPSSRAVRATMSFSRETTLGKAVMSRPLTPANAAAAALASSSMPGRPES